MPATIASPFCDACRRGKEPVEEVENAEPVSEEVTLLIRQVAGLAAEEQGLVRLLREPA